MSRIPGGSFVRDTKATSPGAGTSSGRPGISRFGSVDCSYPSSACVGRGGTVAPSKPGVSDPLRLVKVENPLSRQASQTLGMLEQQNQLKKELKTEVVRDDPGTDWESSLSSWKNRRRSQASYQPKVLELNANENDELDTIANVRSQMKTFHQLMEQRKERSNETNGKGSYMYDEPSSPKAFSRSPEITSATYSTSRQERPVKTGIETTRRVQNSDADDGEEVGLGRIKEKTGSRMDSPSPEIRSYRSDNFRRSATEDSALAPSNASVSQVPDMGDVESRLEDVAKLKPRLPPAGKADFDDERGKSGRKEPEIRKINTTMNETERQKSTTGNDGNFSGSNGTARTNLGRRSLTEWSDSRTNGAESPTENNPTAVWPERTKEEPFLTVSPPRTDEANRLSTVTSSPDSRSTRNSSKTSTDDTDPNWSRLSQPRSPVEASNKNELLGSESSNDKELSTYSTSGFDRNETPLVSSVTLQFSGSRSADSGEDRVMYVATQLPSPATDATSDEEHQQKTILTPERSSSTDEPPPLPSAPPPPCFPSPDEELEVFLDDVIDVQPDCRSNVLETDRRPAEGSKEELARRRFEFLGLKPETSEEHLHTKENEKVAALTNSITNERRYINSPVSESSGYSSHGDADSFMCTSFSGEGKSYTVCLERNTTTSELTTTSPTEKYVSEKRSSAHQSPDDGWQRSQKPNEERTTKKKKVPTATLR